MATRPTSEQINAYLANDREGPVVMINLLRFKKQADGEGAAGEGSGADAYGRYSEVAQQTVAAVGGRFLWAGAVAHLNLAVDPNA